ncbi:M48 family metallopeptidase [Hyalangium rubrum]|uniref:M48 family metallopeptidase n=1 Tax=Hyalangium rubrum TaxID=3103134 RepID=A0ABU5HHW4_9BACT|nr:M48 family metallopeptidase [Hyalangium sp. s54d21]MDY7232946.1 M48 family metallopeptidase [Hyalangium sp. s54d21]
MGTVNSRGVTRRALLTLVLWAGFWAMGAAVVAALAWVPVAESRYTGGLGCSGALAGAGALTVLWALRPRWWFQKRGSDMASLSPERLPELFSLVEEVARRVGTRAPRKVFLVDQATAFISMERRWWGLRREAVVGVGLPLFSFLSREELASVLAHEFGHHVGGDLTLGPWVYRTRVAIASAVESLEDSAFFLDVPFRLYGQLFLRVSSAVSRQQELAADALAARTCGVEATGEALRKVHVLAPLWGAYLGHEVIPIVERSVRVPLLEGFRGFLAEQSRRAEISRDLEEDALRPPSPWDSHPPVEERLKSLGHAGQHEAGRSPLEELKSGSCLELFGGEASAEESFYEHMTRGGLVALRWEELGEKIILPEIAKQLTGSSLDPRRTSLRSLPAMLKEGAALWDKVRPSGLDILSPEAKRLRARQLLVQWLAAALAERGFEPEIRPGANLRVYREDGFVEPAVVVEKLASGAWSDEQYEAWSGPLD